MEHEEGRIEVKTSVERTSSISWIALGIAIVILIIVIILIVHVLGTSSMPIAVPVTNVQSSQLTSGTDMLMGGGNVTYIAKPGTSGLTLNIPPSSLNVTGTIIQVSNQAGPNDATRGNITIAPLSGVTINSGSFGLAVRPGVLAELLATSLNNYIRIS